MKNLFVPYELAKAAKEKGFNESCLGYYSYYSKNELRITITHSYLGIESCVLAPLYQQLVDWFRDIKNIDITIMPVFRDKCGYDSFKRDGYTYTILTIEPCQYLTWSDFNQCAEDRDNEGKEEKILTPSYKKHIDALNKALAEAFKLI